MIVQAFELQKNYRKKVVLNSVDFSLEKGKIYGILGKNGAGKSTLIKIILGLVFQTSGDINVFGKAPYAGNKNIGYLPENICIYPHLSAFDNIYVVSSMCGNKAEKPAIKNILDNVGLADTGRKTSSSFSLGMKRRLQLAMALLIGKREFFILDEPTNGLDANGMIWLKETIASMKKDGATILMASHSTKEMEDIITDYLILHEGSIKKYGVWDSKIMKKTKEVVLQVKPEDVERCSHVINDLGRECETRNDIFIIKTDQSYEEFTKFLSMRNVFPVNVKIIEESLSDLYMNVIKG